MKRIIAIVLIFALMTGMPVDASSRKKQTYPGGLTSLVREYSKKEGFDIVSVGSFGLGLVRMIAKASADSPEDKESLKILDGLNKVIVVEYAGADISIRKEFTEKVGIILDGAEKILEAKDDGETVNIYGTSADKGDSIDDIIIYVPEDCALVCLFGEISMERIADIIEMD